MKTRPISKRKATDKLIQLPFPIVERRADGTVKRDSVGNPIFRPGRPTGLSTETHVAMVRIGFVSSFCRRDGLTHAALNVFLHLQATCSYSEAEIYYSDATGEPEIADKSGRYVYARLKTPGNITTSLTYADIERKTGYSQRTVRDALHELIEKGLLRHRLVPKQSETKHKKVGGRPKELFRFEISSEFAWNGPLQHGLEYPCFALRLAAASADRMECDGTKDAQSDDA